jgi:hypothetical protein
VGFTCSVCGEFHDRRLLDIRLALPDEIHTLAEAERTRRAYVEDDFAVLDDACFFVRGLLEVPIPELGERFAYGAWVEVPAAAFRELHAKWHDPEQFAPVAGALANELAPYAATAGLAATLRATTADRLPAIELADGGHPLIRDARSGIGAARADELAAVVGHV